MALIIGFGLFLVSVLTAALSRVVAEEFVAWTPAIVRRLIRIAVARLPENYRERFEEEWHSHVNEVPGVFGKLLAAADCSRAAQRMALTERRQRLVEGWFCGIERLGESHSKIEILVRVIRDGGGLTSEQISRLNPLADSLDRVLRDSKDLRDHLAQSVSSYADCPTSLVSNLLYRRKLRALEDRFNTLARTTEMSIQRSDEVIRLLNDLKATH
jgi:hypothetical protein